MANALYTKNGHNMFEVSSLIQKAIRRSNKDYACYAANELAPRFRKYLWKRLLCVSVNPEKPDVPLNKNDAFQKVQKRHVQEKR